jgi:MFS family permease
VGHGKILIAGMFISFVGFFALSLFCSSQIGVLIAVALFGFGIGMAQTGNTNLVSVACSKENFGSTTAVNSMILTVGMTVGPVLAALIVGLTANPLDGYIYCWVTAGLLALLAGVFVILNRAELSNGSECPAPHEEIA